MPAVHPPETEADEMSEGCNQHGPDMFVHQRRKEEPVSKTNPRAPAGWDSFCEKS